MNNLLRKTSTFVFDENCIKAFNNLKETLLTYPVLRLYDPKAETELHTDASSYSIAAVMLQKQKIGGLASVAYYSKATNQAEKRYHSYELEMLAIVRAIERFHVYLYDLHFKVITDYNALVHAMNKANLNPRIAKTRWTLQNYHFEIAHRPGKRTAYVDALSRHIAYANDYQ